MWGARFQRQMDPCTFPKHTPVLCNYTFTIHALWNILLHVNLVVII